MVAMEVYTAAGLDSAGLAVEQKDAGAGPVTEADLRINELLVSRISARFPDDGILAEESEDDDEIYERIEEPSQTRRFASRSC